MLPTSNNFIKVEGRPKPHDLVVKGNALVHASYVMERREKLLMWFVIWAFQQRRSQQLTLSCADIGEFLGINKASVYTEVWNIARALRARELLLHDGETGQKTACGFINWVKYGGKRSGEIDVQITDQIVPHIERFIAEVGVGFSKFEMGVIATLKSFYALRLYEMSRAVNFGSYRKDGWELSVDELRKRFGVLVHDGKGKIVVDSYGDWRRFREKVLDKAVEEINAASDLRVSYGLRKCGRQVIAVRLFVASRDIGLPNATSISDLVQRMARLGVSARMAAKLGHQYSGDPTRLSYALKATEFAMSGGKVKNPAAWFVAAVERDDRAKGKLLTPAERDRERRLAAAERERDRQLRNRPETGSDSSLIGDVLGRYDRVNGTKATT